MREEREKEEHALGERGNKGERPYSDYFLLISLPLTIILVNKI
jgi:hypothetical protein